MNWTATRFSHIWAARPFGVVATALAVLSLWFCATSVAVADSLFVSTIDSGSISEYNASSGALVTPNLIPNVGTVFAMASDGDGHLLVASNSTNNLASYNISDGSMFYTTGSGIANAPEGIALDGNGHMFVSNDSQGDVSEYNTSNGSLVTPGLVSSINQPIGVAVDSGGHLFVTDHYDGTVGEYNASNGSVIDASFISGLSGPTSLALDGSGHLYLTETGTGGPSTGSILEYNASTGAFMGTIASGLTLTYGLALDGNNLFVTALEPGYDNQVGMVSEYSLTGGPSNPNFITNLNYPVSLAVEIAPVPEPSSIALLGVGAAGLLIAARRRRKA